MKWWIGAVIVWGFPLSVVSGTLVTFNQVAAIAQPQPDSTNVEWLRGKAPILLAQQGECRQVALAGGAPFYSTLPQPQRTPVDFLAKGARVSYIANSVRGGDGQYYQFVTSPFGGRNTVTGYIPVQYTDRNGAFRNTLEACRRRIMW